ncbi:DUF2911 domain-containing protein [Flavobacteriaceae bacterium R38]|nr:DUF2911 domain-containing protein [Flavobacteriaceae bacterium R38]
MKKFIKWFLIILVVLGIGLFGAYKYMISQTKKASPEDTVEYTQGDLELSVFYNRPYKKGRVIFGSLIPYGKVWRTGANEATTFKTNKDLIIDGQKLPAGKYSVFTIPDENNWQVIFNSRMYSWGVKGPNQSSINRKYDALIANIDVTSTDTVVEQFTISFEDNSGLALVLSWDQTKIVVPIQQ